MCIRDSHAAARIYLIDTLLLRTSATIGQTGDLAGYPAGRIIDPVSYTHLDVYKRQRKNRFGIRRMQRSHCLIFTGIYSVQG